MLYCRRTITRERDGILSSDGKGENIFHPYRANFVLCQLFRDTGAIFLLNSSFLNLYSVCARDAR